MKEILTYYTSNFWVWAGITVGIVVVGSVALDLLRAFFNFIVRLVRGNGGCNCHSENNEPNEGVKEEPKEEIKKPKDDNALNTLANAKITADVSVRGAKNGKKQK